MPQARFVFGNQRTTDNKVALFDIRRGRNEIIAMVDMDYVSLFERAFALLDNDELAKKVARQYVA